MDRPTLLPQTIPGERWAAVLRWLVLLSIIALTRGGLVPAPDPTILQIIFIFSGLYALLLTILAWAGRMSPPWAILSGVTDATIIMLLVTLTGGSHSPLFLFSLLPIVAAAGRSGGLIHSLFLACLLVISLTLVTILYNQGWPPPAEARLLATNSFYMLLVSVFSGWIARQTRLILSAATVGMEQAQKEAHDSLQRAQAMTQVANVLTSTLNYQKVLDSILEEFYNYIHFDVGAVFLFDRTSQNIHVASGRQLGDWDQQSRLPLGKGILSNVAKTGEAEIFSNFTQDPALSLFPAFQLCKSGICVPLRAGFELYGMIVIASQKAKAFNIRHQELLVALCAQAVIGMQNAQLYQSLRHERDRILEAQEDERRRLARDLHDGPAQTLAALAMRADLITRMVTTNPEQAKQELVALADLARRTSKDIRTTLFELRPVVLETQGLIPTLKQYVQKCQESERLPLYFETSDEALRLDPKTESAIFGIIQEAINNAKKYAEAQHIWVRLNRQNESLMVTIQDDGQGFDLTSVESMYDQRSSLGLLNMRERAERIDGVLNISTRRGQGTLVTLTVPMSKK